MHLVLHGLAMAQTIQEWAGDIQGYTASRRPVLTATIDKPTIDEVMATDMPNLNKPRG